MFIKGEKCELRVLHETPDEVRAWTDAVNAGLTTKHLFTGSYPMRYIDVAAKWKKEREAGDVLFGIWAIGDECCVTGKHADGDPMCGAKDQPRYFVGTCGLHCHREIYRSWELRILIHDPEAIGKGIGTEATTMLVNYAFQRLNAHRVWLGCSADNEAAWKTYEKVGFQREGALKEELFYAGAYHDVFRYGILEDTWHATAP